MRSRVDGLADQLDRSPDGRQALGAVVLWLDGHDQPVARGQRSPRRHLQGRRAVDDDDVVLLAQLVQGVDQADLKLPGFGMGMRAG